MPRAATGGPPQEGGYAFVARVVRTFEPHRDLIASVENKWDSTTVSKFEYTNDALGRRTSVTVSGTAFTAAGTTGFDLYTYNDRNEQASAKRYSGGTLENPTNPVYARHFEYAYDPIGNRETYQIGQGTATTYTANELNQYTATADPSESFTHDDDGNLTQDGTFSYVWDAENRLIEAYPTNPTTGSQKCVMTYDYMNRRVQRSLYNWTGSAWAGSYFSSRIFVYDDWNNLIAYNPAGGLSAFRKNTWGLDLSGLNGNSPSPLDPNRDRQGAAIPALHAAGGIAGLIGSTVANGLPPPSYLCFYDANGNLSETIKNSDGTLYSHHEYDPWGKQLVKYESAGVAHPFRYSTKYSDGLFEKYYFGFRYLDFRHARWLIRDPTGESGGTHLHTFVANDPLSNTDSHGLRSLRQYCSRAPIDRPPVLLPIPPGVPPAPTCTATPETHATQAPDCSNCWQTCLENQNLFRGFELGGVICRADGCQCACLNEQLLPPNSDICGQAMRKCVLVHEEWHVFSSAGSCCCFSYPCRKWLTILDDPTFQECTGYEFEHQCLGQAIRDLNSQGNHQCDKALRQRQQDVQHICRQMGADPSKWYP